MLNIFNRNYVMDSTQYMFGKTLFCWKPSCTWDQKSLLWLRILVKTSCLKLRLNYNANLFWVKWWSYKPRPFWQRKKHVKNCQGIPCYLRLAQESLLVLSPDRMSLVLLILSKDKTGIKYNSCSHRDQRLLKNIIMTDPYEERSK